MKDRDSEFSQQVLWTAFLGLLLLISWTKISDYDFWWHLNLGRQIAAEGPFSLRDIFSYTFAGQQQFSGEWLADWLLYVTYELGGYPLVNIFKFALLAGTFYALRRTGEQVLADEPRTLALPAIIVSLTLILFAIRFRLFVRPFLFSYLFFAVYGWILVSYQRHRKPKLLWILPVLGVLWVNTSKGFFLGLILIAVWCGAGLLRRRFDRSLWLILVCVACAMLINPEHIGAYSWVINTAGLDTLSLSGEQQPLSTAMLWGQGWAYTWGFQILLILSIYYVLFLKGWKNWAVVALLAIFAFQAFHMVRMIDFFSLVSIFAIVPAIAQLAKKLHVQNTLQKPSAQQLLAVLLLIVAPVSIWASKSYAFGHGPVESHIPQGAMDFLEKQHISGRVFNSYPFGGYIAWRNPQMPVYIDGRVNQLYTPAFHKQYFKLIHTPTDWNEAEQEWGFEIAIIEYDRMDGGRHFPRHLAENPDWALVYWDTHSAVWLKRSEQYSAIIDRFGYRALRPQFYDFSYLGKLSQSSSSSLLLKNIEHDIALKPDNQEARLALVFLLNSRYGRQYLDRMAQELRYCISIEPDMAMEYSALGMILNIQGNKDEAAKYAQHALAMDPRDPGGLALYKQLNH